MLSDQIKCASGAQISDLVLKNAKIVNVLTGIIEEGDIAICDDRIVGIGKYEGKTEIDCTGKYVLPGLIDTHLHIESSMLSPVEFAKSVVKYGTTSMIIDPHEIANVLGMNGINYMVKELKKCPINAKVMLSSCVPATPFENSGAILDGKVVADNLPKDDLFGLGEFMNYYGVIGADPDVVSKLETARKCNKIVDGHSMAIGKQELNAYLAGGIKTDHECTTVPDMLDRINRGVYIQLREGCATKNVATLVKGITPKNLRRCVFCTDDKHIDDLVNVGHINNNLRVAVKNGLDPIDAVTIATLNAAECYGLKDRGAIAPSYIADLVVVDNLQDFNVDEVLFEGKLVSKGGKITWDATAEIDETVLNSVKLPTLHAENFQLKSNSDNVNTMKLVAQNVVTTLGKATVKRNNGVVDITGSGLVKLAVVERHHNTGNIGIGLLEGYGLEGGAIAQTVAHDSHNVIVMGDNDEDMAVAVNELTRVGGGLTVVKAGKVLGTLRLEIAGLMTNLPAPKLYEEFMRMIECARQLNVSKEVEPFMTMSFLALPVIPFIRVTDKGLFDVVGFKFLPIEAQD